MCKKWLHYCVPGIVPDAGDTVVNETDIASSKILTTERAAEVEVGGGQGAGALLDFEDLIREQSGDIPEKVG